ncbi:MAG: diaminopimelate decarboxylase [Bdellovibrionaceae bacterium]|nr:diaminopimelate decarboxylase [Pseudobdellovibrionaceae bacterium]
MAFVYKNNQLGIENKSGFKSLVDIVPSYDHPIYIYDLDDMNRRVLAYKKYLGSQAKVHYAVKANGNKDILKSFSRLEIGVDVVSQGEIAMALECGFAPEDVIFSGVGKTKVELTYAIEKQIYQINVESPQELSRIGAIAKSLNKNATVAFRFNPDVSPETHPYICTGFRDNKFGMDESFTFELDQILEEFKDFITLQGITLHIGSLIHDISSFKEAVEKTLPLFDHFRSQGHPMKTFDVGGGLGFKYESFDSQVDFKVIEKYGEMIKGIFSDRPEIQIIAEPGRMITGRCGVLLTEIQYIKKSPYKNFAILDTGMHHLMRPCLYSAHHNIDKVIKSESSSMELYDIVGPICESSDVLGHSRNLQKLKQGDLMAIFDAGAYGFSMSSNYNMHGLPGEIVVGGC